VLDRMRVRLPQCLLAVATFPELAGPRSKYLYLLPCMTLKSSCPSSSATSSLHCSCAKTSKPWTKVVDDLASERTLESD